jgi:acyl-CoA synthetase (AMP-forming)/AMP-acid ligase II
MLVFPPSLDFVTALFGCFYAGCVAVPAPYLIGKRAVGRCAAIFQDCEPAAVLTVSRLEGDTEIRGALRSGSTEVAWIHADAVDSAPRPWVPPATPADEVALLQYTSGSISAPKGVMLTHANLTANNLMLRDAFGHTSQNRGVSWLPLFHDMGLIGHVLQPVYVGALSVLMSPLSFLKRPLTWLKAISDWRATTSGGPSSAFDLCARALRPEQAKHLDLSTWSVAYCGSEIVRPDALERFAQAFEQSGFRRKAFTPCYGLAEATLMATASGFGTGVRKIFRPFPGPVDGARSVRAVVGCGRAWSGETIAIVDPHCGRPMSDGDIGEIWVTGPNVGVGYWGNDEHSKQTFRARLEADPRTYLRTGDLGFVQDGELFITGRLKDTIVIRGSKHAPEDIEATVAGSHEVYATQAGAAFAIQNAQEEQVVIVQEIARWARDRDQQNAAVEVAFEHVAREHGLRLFDCVLVWPGAIPRTSSGKVQRHRCREIYQLKGFQRLNNPPDLHWLGVNRADPSSILGALTA